MGYCLEHSLPRWEVDEIIQLFRDAEFIKVKEVKGEKVIEVNPEAVLWQWTASGRAPSGSLRNLKGSSPS